MHSEKDLEI